MWSSQMASRSRIRTDFKYFLGCIDSLSHICYTAAADDVEILCKIERLTLKIDCDGRNDNAIFNNVYDMRALGSNHVLELEISQVDEISYQRENPRLRSIPQPCVAQEITYFNYSNPRSNIRPAPSILSKIESISKFDYFGERDISSSITDLSLLCRSLVTNSKHTLSELRISVDDATIHMDCLNELKNLQELEIPYISFGDRYELFCATLPESLWWLSLAYPESWVKQCHFSARLRAYLDFARSALQVKAERKLKLTTIRFDTETEYLSDEFKTKFSGRGGEMGEGQDPCTLDLIFSDGKGRSIFEQRK